MKKMISADYAPAAIGPYSQAVLVGNTLYCSGQIALNPANGKLAQGNIEAQTQQICNNISAILAAAGHDLSDVVKTTCYLTTMDDFEAFNRAYADVFVTKPARSCIAAKDLPLGALAEIEVISVHTSE